MQFCKLLNDIRAGTTTVVVNCIFTWPTVRTR